MVKNFDGVKVKEGYELMLLMKVAHGNHYNAIIHREKPDDYVFCTNYDITDGTWGQGHYCTKYSGALDEFMAYISW